MPLLRAAGKGAKWAGVAGYEGAKVGARAGRRGASWVADRSEDLWDRVPAEEIASRLGEIEDAKTLAGLLLYLRRRGL